MTWTTTNTHHFNGRKIEIKTWRDYPIGENMVGKFYNIAKENSLEKDESIVQTIEKIDNTCYVVTTHVVKDYIKNEGVSNTFYWEIKEEDIENWKREKEEKKAKEKREKEEREQEREKDPLKYKIVEGYDHLNESPLYQVIGINNQYVGEWHVKKEHAEEERYDLLNHFKWQFFKTWRKDGLRGTGEWVKIRKK